MLRKILKKLRNHHFLSLAGNVVMAGMGLCVYSLLAHNFSTQAELGYWVFFIFTIYTLADVFRTGFVQNSLIKFYSGTSDEHAQKVAGAAWYIGFWITVAGCIINLIFYFIYRNTPDEGTRIMVHWFGITFLVTLPCSVALWILQAEGRFGIILIVRLIAQGLMLIQLLLFVYLHKLTFLHAVYANFIASLLTSIITIIAGWDRIRNVRHRTRQSINEMFHFGKFSVGTSIASQLLKSSDIWVIKFMLGKSANAAVGIYNIPQNLMQMIEIPIRSFTSTVMPMISAASNHNDDEQVAYLMKKFAGMLTLALLPICVVGWIGADIVVDIIGGKKFTDAGSVTVFRIFMSFAMLLPVDRFMGITLDMINKPRINMIKVYVMLTVNVICDILGIIIFHNIYGVAVASIFTFLTGTVFGYVCLKRYLKFTMKDIFTLGYAELRGLIRQVINKKFGVKAGK